MKRITAFAVGMMSWSLALCAPWAAWAEPSLEEAAVEAGRRFDLGLEQARAAAPAAASGRPAPRHDHYWQGVKENDPDNVVSKASMIRGAGAAGHAINALPPVALAGAGRWWGEALGGGHGGDNRLLTRAATLLLPVGLFMVASLALAVIVDNLWDAVEDAVMGRGGLTD